MKVVYIDTESQPILMGYKGSSEMDTGMFSCQFIPGMSDEEYQAVLDKLAITNRPQTEIQKRIMRVVQNGH